MSSEHRMPALDGLRGWAVLAVMFYHFALPMADQRPDRLFWAAERVMLTGWYGVDTFFVLSGFLITGILIDSKSSGRYFKSFYMRRTLRIFPLYYGVLMICFFLLPWLSTIQPIAPHQGWLWLYGANFAPLHGVELSPMFDHFWSLSVEEHFYVVWPLVVYLLSRRTLATFAATLAMLSVVLRCGLIGTGWLSAEAAASLTPCRLDGLVMGALLAAISRGPGLESFVRQALWMACVGGIATLLIKGLGGSRGGAWGASGVGHFTVSLAFAGILVLAVAREGFWSRVLSNRVLGFFGKYSYGIYVFHYLLQPWMNSRFWYFSGTPILSLFIHILAMTVITVAISLISWHLYEKHFLKLKHLFDYRDRRPVPVPVAASN